MSLYIFQNATDCNCEASNGMFVGILCVCLQTSLLVKRFRKAQWSRLWLKIVNASAEIQRRKTFDVGAMCSIWVDIISRSNKFSGRDLFALSFQVNSCLVSSNGLYSNRRMKMFGFCLFEKLKTPFSNQVVPSLSGCVFLRSFFSFKKFLISRAKRDENNSK